MLQDLSIGSSLGKLMSIKGVGRQTVIKLVNNGYTNLSDVSQLAVSDMQGLGINKSQATRIVQYIKRASR